MNDPGGRLPEDRRRQLHLLIGGEPQLLEIGSCGDLRPDQEPRRELADPLRAAGKTVHLIGRMRCRDGAGCPAGGAEGTRLALEI